MKEFGLTGGIGSGKTTVSSLLSQHGAVVIDADALVHRLQQPGELVFAHMVERWGDDIVNVDGTLDRSAVGTIVFNDPSELEALNQMVHPAVAAETERIVSAQRDTDAIVVHDIPLLVLPGGELLASRELDSWSGIIVVDTPKDLAIERVVASRGMEPSEVESRMAVQASRDDRRSVASFIVDNSGTLIDLEREVERLWEWMNG